MQARSNAIVSPLRFYVARLMARDQAKKHTEPASDARGGPADNTTRPGIEALEQRLLLSASFTPFPEPGADVLETSELPQIDLAETTAALTGTTSVKWRGEYVEAAEYEWIVKFNDDRKLDDTQLTALSESLSPNIKIESLTSYGLGLLTAPLPNLKGWQLNRWAGTQDAIDYIEPNFIYSPTSTVPNDTNYGDLWGLKNTGQNGGTAGADIDAELAWDLTTGSKDVVIAVIDTGINYRHADLADNIWVNQGEVPGDGIDNDGNGFIDDFHGFNFGGAETVNAQGETLYKDPIDAEDHGTHVAGTIGAVGNNDLGVTGVNWEVSMMAMRASHTNFFGDQKFSDIDVIQTYDYLVMMKEQFGVNIVATNNSYGGRTGFSSAYLQALTRAQDAGILMVMAAGNDNDDLDTPGVNFYPAEYNLDNIIAVTGTNQSDGQGFNFGKNSVELGAPSAFITSTGIYDSYPGKSGTSMAAPHVTGVIGLLAAYKPSATDADYRQAILDGVDLIPSLTNKTITGGRLNAYGALTALDTIVAGPRVESLSLGYPSETASSLAVTFTEDIVSASAVAANFQIIEAGSDGEFDTGDDVTITLSSLSHTADEVTLSFGSNLAAGKYRLTLIGTGANPIRNSNSDALNNGEDGFEWFGIEAVVGANENNNTLATATDTNLNGVGSVSYSAEIGDGYYRFSDSDLYSLDVNAGETIVVDIDAQSIGSDLDAVLRIFDDSGNQLRINDDTDGLDSYLAYVPDTTGTYYVGVSGYGNSLYDPTVVIDGENRSFGDYDLDISVLAAPASSASISGTVWNDVNGNGLWDQGEVGLYRSSLFLDEDGDGIHDVGEPSVLTDENGAYAFRDVAPRAQNYVVDGSPLTDWQWTHTPASVQVGTGSVITGVDFGMSRSSVPIKVGSTTEKVNTDYSLGDMGLREALELASIYSGTDVIQFDTSMLGDTIVLDSGVGELIVGSDVDIEGPGTSELTIDASKESGVFEILNGATVSISDLTITGGDAWRGGGVNNKGNATLTGLIIQDSYGVIGGGVFNQGDMLISGSSIVNNGSHGVGNDGTIDIYNSTISGNASIGYMGLTVAGSALVINTTITNNDSPGQIGGIILNSSSMEIHNSIVAGNGNISFDTHPDIFGALDFASSNNIIGADAVGFGSSGLINGFNGNQIGSLASPLDPLLGGLADNGGPTMTHALLAGSPAIDAGSDSQATGLATDQRGTGFARIVDRSFDGGDAVDIGAFEATDYVVSTLTDENDTDYTDGDLSLREALGRAAANAGPDVITFNPSLSSGTITLSLGYLNVNSDVDINGLGSSLLTVDANNTSQVFVVTSGTTAAIRDMKITRGLAAGGSDGGGVYNSGDVTLEDVLLTNNQATNNGGGLFNNLNAGTATLVRTEVTGNTSTFAAGGVGTSQGASLVIVDSTISGNSSGFMGGGLSSEGTTTVSGSTISGNSSTYGGGVGNNVGAMTLQNTTISGNSATVDGGGIVGASGSLALTNTTVTNNRADSDNNATGSGGGVMVYSGTSTLHNNIVAGNFRGTGTTADDVVGTFAVGSSYNLIGSDSVLGNNLDNGVNNNQVGGEGGAPAINPLLGALANNGGLTMTHALLAGSVAIDAGDNTYAPALGLWDQRGDSFSRLKDGDGDTVVTIDIGAYEL